MNEMMQSCLEKQKQMTPTEIIRPEGREAAA